MNILDKIIIDKKREVELKKSIIPVSQLEASVLFNSRTYSMSKLLRNSVSGIIAEHKRRSPSKTIINNNHSVEDVVLGYQNAGVCGISILTDTKYAHHALSPYYLLSKVGHYTLIPAANVLTKEVDVTKITVEALTELNENGGEANVSTGYHAIEFLLWGQDQDYNNFPTGHASIGPAPAGFVNGTFTQESRRFRETNTDILISATKSFGDFDFNFEISMRTTL